MPKKRTMRQQLDEMSVRLGKQNMEIEHLKLALAISIEERIRAIEAALGHSLSLYVKRDATEEEDRRARSERWRVVKP